MIYYLVVTRISTLLIGITSNYNGNFYCLNYVPSFRTRKKLKLQENVCENKDFWSVTMSCEENILLEFTENLKPVKLPFLLYADLECWIKNISGSKNNSKKIIWRKKEVYFVWFFNVNNM